MEKIFSYTAVIRTLGKAGEKYQVLLDSLANQSIQPQKILVYIAEGFEKPKETIGREQYVYVRKGMVAQRALPYYEVDTEYILFLDDDVYLPEKSVEQMFQYLFENNADIISPDVFHNSERSFLSKLAMSISGRMIDRKDDGKWGYKVMSNSGYSYNSNPKPGVYLSQTNAGPCFLCSKDTFMNIHYEEELWLDRLGYALGEDQVMFYKMYCKGFKQLTWFHSGIVHLDAGSTLRNKEKEESVIYADFRFKAIFWHRFIYLPEKSTIKRFWYVMTISYTLGFTILISLLKLRTDILRLKLKAIKEAVSFIKSEEYSYMPLIQKTKR